MKIAVLSDIHGNRHALQAVLTEVNKEAVDEIWCLGDLVGYGGDPDLCVELARANFAICLAGNHDLAARGDLAFEDFSVGAELAARWTAETMRPDNLDYLKQLKSERIEEDLALYHASPRDPIWEYVLSTLLAELCLDSQARRVALIGHSHVALSFNRPAGEPATGEARRGGSEVDVAEGEWLLNPGSVGQPRDGDPRAAWLILDSSRWSADFRRTEYDVEGAAAAIRAARLPESLAERLAYGQ